MNFADTLCRVDQRLTAQEGQASGESLREEYARLREFLAQRAETGQDVERRVKILRVGGFALSSVGGHADRLAETAQAILAECRQQAESLASQGDRWQTLLDEEHALNEALTQLYAEFRADIQFHPTPLFYRLIARSCSGRVREVYERLERIDADLSRLVQDDIPTLETTLMSARSLKQERDRLRAEIEEAVSADVTAFVKSLAAGRATLNDLTPEVLAWLKEHGGAQSIRLTM